MQLHELVAAIGSQLADVSRKPNVLTYSPNKNGQEQFHQSEAQGRLLVGSNRGGKTVAGSCETTWRLTGRHPFLKTHEPPVAGRVLTVDYDNGADQIIEPAISQWLPPSELRNGSWEDSYNRRRHLLTLRNGSTLEVKTHQQELEALAGTARHFLWCDEEPPKAHFYESITRLLDYNGVYFITMTPVEGMTWVYNELVERQGDNNVEVINISVLDNKHISEEARNLLGKDLSDEDKQIRIDGQFIPKGGLVLKEFSRENNVIRPGVPSKAWSWYLSIDHGYNNPSGIYWHAVSPSGLIITFYEHYRSQWTVKMHAGRIKEINKELGYSPAMTVGDPSMSQRSAVTGASILVEYRNEGVPVIPGKRDVAGGINKMNEYLRQKKWLITENCVNLLREIRTYRWKTYQSSKVADQSNKREDPNKKDDHGVDSCRYLFSFMPDLRPLPISDEKVELSRTRTDPKNFPWRVDENLVNFSEKEPDVAYGEIL